MWWQKRNLPDSCDSKKSGVIAAFFVSNRFRMVYLQKLCHPFRIALTIKPRYFILPCAIYGTVNSLDPAMPISIEEVEKAARLAKLEFEPEEKITLSEQLDEIVRYVQKLDELDTEDVAPMVHISKVKNVLREDKAKQEVTRVEALQNAPRKSQGFFSVPKVIR